MTACHLPTQWMPIVRICARSIRCARTMVLMPRSGFPSARRIRARATIHPRAVSPSPPGRLLPLAVRAQPLHESSPTVDTALVRTSARGAAPTTQPPTWTCRLSIGPVSEQPIRLRGDATPATVEQDLASLHRCSVHATGNRGARRNRPTPHAPQSRTDGFDPHVRSKNTMPHRRGRSPWLTYRPAGGAHGTVHRSRAALGYRLNMTPDHRWIRRHPHNGHRQNRPAACTHRFPSGVRNHRRW